jgi:hypothetical protein
METDRIPAGRAALSSHDGKNAVDIFRNCDAIGLNQSDGRIMLKEAGDDELAMLIVHCDRRTEEIVAFAGHAAHVRGVTTGAMSIVKFLAAKEDILGCEGTDELIEFVRAPAGAAGWSGGRCRAAGSSAGAAGGGSGRLLRH